MKHFIIIIFLLSIFLQISDSFSQPIPDFVITTEKQASQYINNNSSFVSGWQMVQTPAPRFYMTDLFFIDSLFGWASHSGVGIGIVKTTDGGNNWDSVLFSPLGNFLSSIYFVDRYTGWTCGSNGVIRKTTDGGKNWISQDFLQGTDYYTLYFENSYTGYIAGNNSSHKSLIIKTTNSGASWEKILDDTVHNFTEIYCSFWIDSKMAWFGGRDVLLKTTDAGNTFTNMFLPFQKTYAFGGIYFLNELTGWVGGNDGTGKNIYKTTNGGNNWAFQYNPASQYTFPQINDYEFISKDTGWAVAMAGSVLITTNGGLTWSIDLNVQEFLGKLCNSNHTKIWCTGDFGQIWYRYINKTVGINENNILMNDFKLYQNYPNPFNPETKIKYDLRVIGFVNLKVYDVSGKEVKTIVNEMQNPGSYSVAFNGDNLSSGVYFYKIEAGEFREIKRMLLIK